MATYLVTGSSRGIGLEFVRQLTARGDTVLAAARQSSAVPPGRGVTPLRLDVTNAGDLAELARTVAGRPIDVLINNAGVSGVAKKLADLTSEELERVWRINSIAPLMVTRALLPNLRAGGQKKVINISSKMGSLTNAANTMDATSYSYRSSKSVLNMLTVCLANELRGEGLTCVSVHPGWVKTDMGGKEAPLSPQDSVAAMVKTIDALRPERTGEFIERDGRTIEW